MIIDLTHIKLFVKGSLFKQTLFLDNFYDEINLNEAKEQELILLLNSAIDNGSNNYIKRSAFVILCELTLIKKNSNEYVVLKIIKDFLSSRESSLIIVALKFIPYFFKSITDQTIDRIKQLSDSFDGDIASQSYFCLGLIELNKDALKTNIDNLIQSLFKPKQYFSEAVSCSENREDAKFYLLLIDWIELIMSDSSSVLLHKKFQEIEKNLQNRILYNFSSSSLEIDFIIFLLLEKLKLKYNITSQANKWIDIRDNVQKLLDVKLELQKIKNFSLSHQSLVEPLYSNIIENIKQYLYNTYLFPEKERLKVLEGKLEVSKLKEFINNLINSFPVESVPKNENHKLLALFVDKMGAKDGLALYQNTKDRSISPELVEAISILLEKSKNDNLSLRTGSIVGEEILTSLIDEMDKLLPNYNKEKKEVFFNIIEEIIRYAKVSFTGNEKKRFKFIYSQEAGGLGQKALEEDLQDSMIVFFEHSKIADGLDHEKAKFVDGGRVDIVYKKDIITIPIELKKSLVRHDETSLEENYIAQAQTYASGYDQLGIFVLLELSDKSSEAPPDFRDWFKIHHLPPSTNMNIKYPNYIISIVIPGNRTLPSSKSNYK